MYVYSLYVFTIALLLLSETIPVSIERELTNSYYFAQKLSVEKKSYMIYILHPSPFLCRLFPISPTLFTSYRPPYPTQTTSGPLYLLCPLPRTLFLPKVMCLTSSCVQMLLTEASLRHLLPNTNHSLSLPLLHCCANQVLPTYLFICLSRT